VKNKYRELVEEILASVGIRVNGKRIFDIQVKNEDFFKRFIKEGTLGLGESYVEGWWECDRLDEMFARLIQTDFMEIYKNRLTFIFYYLRARLSNVGKKPKAFEIGKRHYDIGNDLFQCMLDKRMVYSCAYWEDAENLDQAQEKKLDLICRKLGLQPNMKILDLGCGWGSFIKFAAERYGVEAVGVTVSEEQVKLGKEICIGLPVEIRLQDYRDVKGKFDRVVAIGMIEHVNYKNYRMFFKLVHNSLKDDGLLLLQTIGLNKTMLEPDPWFEKYIFPNSMLPSVKLIGESMEGLFVMEDWQNFGTEYDKTLMAWHQNFLNNWEKLRNSYGDRFFRMWKYYLLMCAGLFRGRFVQLWQVVLSKKGILEGYQRNIHYDFFKPN
jgi:cyclopropane-fatty-acyl-phospholipid synthase